MTVWMRWLPTFCMFACLMTFCAGHTVAQQVVRYDSSEIRLSSFDTSRLGAFRRLPQFDYDRKLPQGMSLWDRFWRWLWNSYNAMAQYGAVRTGMKILFWLLPVLVLVYAALRLIGMEKNMLWGSNRRTLPSIVPLHDQGWTADGLRRAIEEAEARHAYRDAIRYQYLLCLTQLRQTISVTWPSHATNQDIIRAVQNWSHGSEFRTLTTIYEYVWYGDFTLTGDRYRAFSKDFRAFQNQLSA